MGLSYRNVKITTFSILDVRCEFVGYTVLCDVHSMVLALVVIFSIVVQRLRESFDLILEGFLILRQFTHKLFACMFIIPDYFRFLCSATCHKTSNYIMDASRLLNC